MYIYLPFLKAIDDAEQKPNSPSTNYFVWHQIFCSVICKSYFRVSQSLMKGTELQFVLLTVFALRLTTFKTEKSIFFCYFPLDTVRMHRLQKQGLYWASKLKSVARDTGVSSQSVVTNLPHLPFKCRRCKAYDKFSTAQLV